VSLDNRLRDGLRDEADRVDPDVELWLADARRLHGRRRARRQVALAAALVGVLLLVAVPVGRQLVGRDEPVPTGPVTGSQARRLLTDSWVTPTLGREWVAAVLVPAGLGDYVDAVALDAALPDAWNLQLGRDGRYGLQSARGVTHDGGTWRVRARTLVLSPDGCDCRTTFRWTVRDEQLSLRLLSDDGPDVDGVPDRAYALAYYTTAPFTRFSASLP
jgi:hypothetical protein